jgi:predicted  nucleic acid-binding Zn-ribbon protein
MKKSILLMAIFTFTVGSLFTGCQNSAKKVENAEENLTEAKEDLRDAREEYREDIENYRLETAEMYEANNRSIAAFNQKMANEKNEVKMKYNKEIGDLELKNREMKKKMDEFNAESQEQWEKFKSDFKRDMDQLGKALADLTLVNNK